METLSRRKQIIFGVQNNTWQTPDQVGTSRWDWCKPRNRVSMACDEDPFTREIVDQRKETFADFRYGDFFLHQ
jgi:hypothetical protein